MVVSLWMCNSILMDVWVVPHFLDKINNAIMLSTASQQYLLIIFCAVGTGMNGNAGWRAEAQPVPVETGHFSASCCVVTSCPAPLYVGLALWGDPPYNHVLAVRSGRRWEPQAQHLGSVSHGPVTGGPCILHVWPDHWVCPELTFQPTHEGKSWDVVICPAVGRAPGRLTSSLSQ